MFAFNLTPIVNNFNVSATLKSSLEVNSGNIYYLVVLQTSIQFVFMNELYRIGEAWRCVKYI